jgi:hypothetical protein
MNSVGTGVMIAVGVAGWPLYTMVTTGGLSADSAMLRGGVVAAACAAGVTAVVRLALTYEAQTEVVKRRKLDALFSDMEGAVANGTLKTEGTDQPPE